jgi:hypothetical protein
MAAARSVITFPVSLSSRGKTRRKLEQCHPIGLSPPETLAGHATRDKNSAAFLAVIEIRCVALWFSGSESGDCYPGISGQQ